MYIGNHLKHPLFLPDIFEKKTQKSNFMPISPMAAEFFGAEGQRDRNDASKRMLFAI